MSSVNVSVDVSRRVYLPSELHPSYVLLRELVLPFYVES